MRAGFFCPFQKDRGEERLLLFFNDTWSYDCDFLACYDFLCTSFYDESFSLLFFSFTIPCESREISENWGLNGRVAKKKIREKRAKLNLKDTRVVPRFLLLHGHKVVVGTFEHSTDTRTHLQEDNNTRSKSKSKTFVFFSHRVSWHSVELFVGSFVFLRGLLVCRTGSEPRAQMYTNTHTFTHTRGQTRARSPKFRDHFSLLSFLLVLIFLLSFLICVNFESHTRSYGHKTETQTHKAYTKPLFSFRIRCFLLVFLVFTAYNNL